MDQLSNNSVNFELDDNFFASYEQELANISLQSVAQDALADILTLRTEDGQTRSRDQIKAEAEQFFANPIIARDISLLDNLARQYAQLCNHDHGLAQELNAGPLSDIYKRGIDHEGHDHSQEGKKAHGQKEKNRKKEKKKKTSSWLDWFVKIERKEK